jgi:hypothetical protein
MGELTISLNVAEAQIALGAIQDKQLDASRLAAISTGDEHEIADLTAKMLSAVVVRITDALYPDTCRWLDDEPCERPIASQGLCSIHLNHRTRVAEFVAS